MVLQFFSINKTCSSEVLFSGSKFLGFLKQAASQEEAEVFISEIKKKHAYADHVCFAYLIVSKDGRSIKKKASDGGEPLGTAGRPILDFLTGKKLYNAVAVVVRYFGGTLLGTGGLARAYASAAEKCLQDVNLKEKRFSSVVEATVFYNEITKLEQFTKQNNIEVLDSLFLEDVVFELAFSFNDYKKQIKELNDFLGRAIEIKVLSHKFV